MTLSVGDVGVESVGVAVLGLLLPVALAKQCHGLKEQEDQPALPHLAHIGPFC